MTEIQAKSIQICFPWGQLITGLSFTEKRFKKNQFNKFWLKWGKKKQEPPVTEMQEHFWAPSKQHLHK